MLDTKEELRLHRPCQHWDIICFHAVVLDLASKQRWKGICFDVRRTYATCILRSSVASRVFWLPRLHSSRACVSFAIVRWAVHSSLCVYARPTWSPTTLASAWAFVFSSSIDLHVATDVKTIPNGLRLLGTITVHTGRLIATVLPF